jgi:hypothetical protein
MVIVHIDMGYLVTLACAVDYFQPGTCRRQHGQRERRRAPRALIRPCIAVRPQANSHVVVHRAAGCVSLLYGFIRGCIMCVSRLY